MALTAALFLLNLLYVYGSMRLRSKRMGRFSSAITAFWAMCAAAGTIIVCALAFKTQTARLWTLRQGIGAVLIGQMVVAALIIATGIYSLVVASTVSKLKAEAIGHFNNLLIMSWVSTFLCGASYYTYWLALYAHPQINLLHFTALGGVVSQVLLLSLSVQLTAWRYAVGEEYAEHAPREKLLVADDEATDSAFAPPQDDLRTARV